MQAIYLLIPIAVILFFVAIAALWWAINNGQYDDLDKTGHDILFDDDQDRHDT